MENSSRMSLTIVVVPTAVDTGVSVTVHNPKGTSGPVQGRSNLLPLVAAIVRLKVEAIRQPRLATVRIDEHQFGASPAIFHSAWNFLKNVTKGDPDVQAGNLLCPLGAWLTPKQHEHSPFIELNLEGLPYGNLSFSVAGRDAIQHECLTDSELMILFEFLTNRRTTQELFAVWADKVPNPVFEFGNKSTGTVVIQRFADGLPPEFVTCSLTQDAFVVPKDIESLIERAHQVLRHDVPQIFAMKDQPMLAPSQLKLSMTDLDSGQMHVGIWFSDSSYWHYAAFAFAELLAGYSNEFGRLLEFARDTPNRIQPAPATCSMGVRVLVETSDDRLLVAHRSDQVKLNPNVWSVSANEGIRRSLLKRGLGCEDLLTLGVNAALSHELKVFERECLHVSLLSIYRNKFNQWGAGFTVKTSLTSEEVMARQVSASHAFEHRKFAALPLDVESCGKAMGELGERWYGGALETLCQFFAWRDLEAGKYVNPAEIGVILQETAGGVIQPIDEANRTLLPSR
jgi:hypothetical protein